MVISSFPKASLFAVPFVSGWRSRSPMHHLEPGLRDHVHSGNFSLGRAVQIQEALHDIRGEPVPVAFDYARRVSRARKLSVNIRSGKTPVYVLGYSMDPERRFYLKDFDFPYIGRHEQSYISYLQSELKADRVLARVNFSRRKIIPVGRNEKQALVFPVEWFESLLGNRALDSRQIEFLAQLGRSPRVSNQGPGLGSWCERRLALALARLQDLNLINDFELCGEAGLPVRAASEHLPLDYNSASHEEALGIDALVKLKSALPYEYAFVQVKAQGATGHDQTNATLVLSGEEVNELVSLVPQLWSLIVKDPTKQDEYLLTIQRRVFRFSVADKKMVKEDAEDFSPDLVNGLIAALDHFQTEPGQTLVLDRAYESLSFPEKIVALMKQNFLIPQEFAGFNYKFD
ncbi:MAG: hypothetical protein OXU45_05775 [Candidatus Melainabacteria bacterium]|nr:hypothetical protein [Candidatus Melainabacteria bacterium]